MADHPEKEDQRPDDEAIERMNRALKRALSTPPKPKKSADQKPKKPRKGKASDV